MQFTTSYQSVFRTFQATDHFNHSHRFQFQPCSEYSAQTAWWMGNFARWAYRDSSESSDRRIQRAELRRSGFHELCFIADRGIHASLVRSEELQLSVLAFRGTSRLSNWMVNLNTLPFTANAHPGYTKALDRVWGQIEPLLNTDEPLFFTGHSLGGALAVLAAKRVEPTAVYTFGCPPLGNQSLVDELQEKFVYRLVNYRDFASRDFERLGIHHVGTQVYFNHDHQMQLDPCPISINIDQDRGTRTLTRQLNRNKLTPLPETLTDHSPQNYLAGLELVCGEQNWTSAEPVKERLVSPEGIAVAS